MIKKISAFVCLILPFYGYALVEHELNEEHTLHVSFSRSYLNRIKIEGSQIHEIRFSDDLQISKDEMTGQAFVSLANADAAHKVQQITLTSTSGRIQDILIEFQNQERELLVIKDLALENKEKPGQNPVVSILAALKEQRVPDTFKERGLYTGEKAGLRKGALSMKPVKIFEAPNQSLCVWELKNTAKQTSFLSERDFTNDSTEWIYLEKSILAGMEKTHLITLSRGL